MRVAGQDQQGLRLSVLPRVAQEAVPAVANGEEEQRKRREQPWGFSLEAEVTNASFYRLDRRSGRHEPAAGPNAEQAVRLRPGQREAGPYPRNADTQNVVVRLIEIEVQKMIMTNLIHIFMQC